MSNLHNEFTETRLRLEELLGEGDERSAGELAGSMHASDLADLAFAEQFGNAP